MKLPSPLIEFAAGSRVAFLLLFLGAGLVFLEPCRGASDGFEITGSLETARGSHTATLLPDGKVLVVGGTGPGDVSLSSTELYDPASGTWTATGSLAIARRFHTATLLPDGKVLVAGGFGFGNSVAIAELYDPATGTWTATGSLVTARDQHTATLLPDGKVLVAAGFYSDLGYGGFSLASAELYDPATGNWTATGSLTTARNGHTATLLPNGNVLLTAGINSNSYGAADLASTELYDPASGMWTTTGSLATARDLHTATLLFDGKVLVAAGISDSGFVASAELYDPASGTWTATGSLAAARGAHTATLLLDGKVLVAAGPNTSGALASAELYDPVSGAWTATDTLATARLAHTATLLLNGNVLIGGGTVFFNNDPLASAELYVPPPTPPTLLNISTRLSVGTGNNVLIGGFIITGTGDKNVIVRAIGPSLGAQGIAGALADPVLELHDQTGAIIATNDNWKDTQQGEIEATTIPPSDDKESAIVQRLTPGAYTAIVRGENDTTGIGLVETYGLDGTATLANISTRGFVQTGDNVMIGGFIVLNTGVPTKLIVRAIGPSLSGIANVMADPTLELHDSNGVIVASNDNWQDTQKSEIEATIPPTDDRESAIVQTLSAGAYTAIVRGKNNATGIALIEAYNLQ